MFFKYDDNIEMAVAPRDTDPYKSFLLGYDILVFREGVLVHRGEIFMLLTSDQKVVQKRLDAKMKELLKEAPWVKRNTSFIPV